MVSKRRKKKKKKPKNCDCSSEGKMENVTCKVVKKKKKAYWLCRSRIIYSLC